MTAKAGDYIKILRTEGEAKYAGKVGKVTSAEGGRLKGDWGPLALVEGEDEFTILPKERTEMLDYCLVKGAGREGMSMLCDYYVRNLGWSEAKAADYALALMKDGTIDEVIFLGRDGKRI